MYNIRAYLNLEIKMDRRDSNLEELLNPIRLISPWIRKKYFSNEMRRIQKHVDNLNTKMAEPAHGIRHIHIIK